MHIAGNNNFSIIMPTFEEAKNIPELIKRIGAIDFGPRLFEVIIVDDNSQDGTNEIVNSLLAPYPWLRLIVRRNKKGLSEAVIEGLRQAKYSTYVIMDADLSHPPEKIPEMLKVKAEPGVDLVIGSRYIMGGSSDEMWPLGRKFFSRLAILFARVLIPVPVKDPLSGFLIFEKATYLSVKEIDPIGWKIGLEIMVKCRCKNIKEVPIHFSQRARGSSKLNLLVALNYLRHVNRLVWHKFSVHE